MMMKRIAAVVVLGVLAGCASHPEPATINVYVDRDGNIFTQGFSLKKEDMPAFAKQVGDDNVVITSVGANVTPEFGKAVEARDALKDAGVKNVTIGVKNP